MTTHRPYGQGRTARAPEARMTPEALEALKAILDKDGVSYADWLEKKITEDTMGHSISVKSAKDIDGANAYYVTKNGETFAVHTDQRGRGLWIDGKQVEGLSQFNAGKNPAAAYRRYFSK